MHLYIRFRHKNIVQLMGYCDRPPALIYEFMENGSLFHHLHSKVRVSLRSIMHCSSKLCAVVAHVHHNRIVNRHNLSVSGCLSSDMAKTWTHSKGHMPRTCLAAW